MRFRKLKPSDVGGDEHRHLRTGMKALLDVLRQRPAAVLLFGFDFYSGTDLGFSDYYRGVSSPLSSFHSTRDELLLFRRLLRQHRNTLFIHSKLARVCSNSTLHYLLCMRHAGPETHFLPSRQLTHFRTYASQRRTPGAHTHAMHPATSPWYAKPRTCSYRS